MAGKGPVRSAPKRSGRGLPQGGVLSPMLWNLFFGEARDALLGAFSQRDIAQEQGVELYIC